MAESVLRRGINHALERVWKEPVTTLSRYYTSDCSERLRKSAKTHCQGRRRPTVKLDEDLAEIRKEANTVPFRTLANMTESLLPSAAEFLFD